MDPMTNTSPEYAPGVPCWTDLMVADPDAVKPFYEAVLGWSFTEPDEQFGGYVMAMKDGAPAAGLGPAMDDSRAAWTMYFSCADIEAAAAATRANYGVLFRDPDQVGDLGKMFVATDPTGAVFGVWQPGTFPGAGIVNAPGGLTWEDLRSTDPDAARNFYNAVFGFDYEPIKMAGDEYMSFSTAGSDHPRGGIGGMMGAEGVTSHWLLYFGVSDVAAAIEAATGHGGAAPVPAFDTPYGKMAGLTDPAGATVYIVEMPPAQT